MAQGMYDLARALARASKCTDDPMTIRQAEWAVRALMALMADELVQPEGRIEVENFVVLQNRLYIQTGLCTRTISLRLSPHLKRRLRAAMTDG